MNSVTNGEPRVSHAYVIHSLMKATMLVIISAVLFNSTFARPGRTVHGSGPVVRAPIVVEPIRGIRVTGAIDVVITQAQTQSVMVEAQANLIPLVLTTVRDGIWTIDTGDKQYSTTERFVVHLSVPSIDHITSDGPASIVGIGAFATSEFDVISTGSGSVTITVAADRVTLLNDGPGAITIGGTCSDLNATARDSGPILTKDMTSASAKVRIDGNGDITLRSSGRVLAVITGSGDVVISGTPSELVSEIDGPGNVLRAEDTQH